MARDHARILTAIWTNKDFLTLSVGAQRLYLLILSQSAITQAGTIPYQPRRWANMAAGTDLADITGAAADLEAARFVVIDRDTEEMLVRSFVRNDGVLVVPNVARAMVKAYRNVMSERLAVVFLAELQRLHEDRPTLAGWKVAEVAELLGEPFPHTPTEPLAEPFGQPLPEPISNEGLSDQALSIPLSPIPYPPSTPSGVDAGAADKPRQSKRTRIPDDWQPSDGAMRWAVENFPTLDIDRQLAQFRDHHTGKGSVMASWDATWRTWMRNAESYARPTTGSKPATTDVRLAQGLALAAHFDELDAQTPPALEAS